MEKPPRILTLLLTALVAFGPVSTDLYLPSLPAMTRVFGTSVSQVQLTLSVFIAGFAVAQLVYGPLSDQYGRRPVLLTGVSVYLAATVFCLCVNSIGALIVGRFLQALGACSGPVLGRAIVRDLYPRDQAARVLATMASAMALAPAVGPMLGGVLQTHFGWQANFVVMALFGVCLLAAGWRLLPETNQHRDPHALAPLRMLENYLALARDKAFLGNTLTLSFVFAAMFSFISGASFVVIEVLQVPPEHFGFCFTAVIIGYMTGSQAAARLTHRLGAVFMIRAGVLLALGAGLALAGLAAAHVQTIVAVIAPMSALFLAAGLSLPNCTAAAIAPHARIAGSASALLGFTQMAVATVAGWAVGRLDNGTSLPMAAVIAAMVAVAALFYWRLLVKPAKAQRAHTMSR